MDKIIKIEKYDLQIIISNKGFAIALIIFICWILNLVAAFSLNANENFFLAIILILIQTHLYTGLFITAHDAMHGTISPNKKWNDLVGKTATFLYAFFNYKKLFLNHHKHHDHVGDEQDPDYYEGGFFSWYFQFLKHYISFWQIIYYAISFNLLKLFLEQDLLLLFWILPALLSTLQLFYFGTYLPHHRSHHKKNIHKSSSFKKNHFLAFVSCYFFGYHFEHHEFPYVPWWQLWKVKNLQIGSD